MDLVISAYGAGSGVGIHVYKNVNKASSWTSHSTDLPTSGDYIENAPSDVTGDGNVDIVTGGSYGSTYGIHIYEGDGEGTWTESSPGLPTTNQYMGVDLGDYDSDGDLDLVVGLRSGSAGVQVWRNPQGPPPPAVTDVSPTGDESWTGGSEQTIGWTASGASPPYAVSIHYSIDGGATYPNEIVSGIAQDEVGSMQHTWTLPRIDSANVRVRVDVTDSQLVTGYAESRTDLVIDSTGPSVATTSPVGGASDVSINTPVTITFSEGMDPSTSDAVSISGPGSPTLSSPSWAGAQLTFQTSGLEASSSYSVAISTAAMDGSDPGNPLGSAHSFTFETGTEATPTPPLVVSTDPNYGQADVDVRTTIVITFNKAMERSSTEAAMSSSPSIAYASSWSYGDTKLTLTPRSMLSQYTEFTMTVGTGASSTDFVNLDNAYSFAFTTGATPDTTPPRVSWTSPDDMATSVGTSSTITIVFTESMETTGTNAAVSMTPGAIISKEWSNDGTRLTLTAQFSPGISYTVSVSTDATDLASNRLLSGTTFTFITEELVEVEGSTPGPTALSAMAVLVLGSILVSRRERLGRR